MENEKWLPVVGYERNYEVSNLGRVRRREIPNSDKTFRVDKDGYLLVKMNVGGVRIRRPVHILVLEAFVGLRSPGTQTRHINGIPTDNRLKNLAWGTPKEDAADRERHGTILRGERHYTAIRRAQKPV